MGGPLVPTFCPLCVSRCGARAEVADGKLLALLPDPSHPTGRAICLKGKAAPEIVDHPSRLLHPLRRTRPKDASDPGWERITWDRYRQRAEPGPARAGRAGWGATATFGKQLDHHPLGGLVTVKAV